MRQDVRPGDGAPEQQQDQRALAVVPVRLRDPGGGRQAAGLALVGLVAVVVAALAVAGQLPVEVPPSPAVRASLVAAPPSPASASPADMTPAPPTATMTPPLTTLGAGVLVRAVRNGSLNGRLVIVQGDLEVIELPCDRPPSTSSACVVLSIRNLDLPVEAGAVALPWHETPVQGDWLVTVVESGRLRYLGSLAASAYEPGTLDQLTLHLLARDLDEPPRTLFVADGWLIVNPPHTCYRRAPGATPCPTPAPFLAGDKPFADGVPRGSRGAPVDLVSPAGVDPAATVTEGPFLVTLPAAAACRPGSVAPGCAEGTVRWALAARYDPRSALLVAVP
jgi:hypothetical protein